MDTDLTPLGVLLEAVRQAKRPKLSQNAVAKAAGTSSTTYRRIISGVSRFGGQDVPFAGSADTVAQIARVLAVSPAQLEGVGRADAAEELRHLAKDRSAGSAMDRAEAKMAENERMAADLAARVMRLKRLQQEAVEQVVRAFEAEQAASREPDNSNP